MPAASTERDPLELWQLWQDGDGVYLASLAEQPQVPSRSAAPSAPPPGRAHAIVACDPEALRAAIRHAALTALL